MRTWLPLLAGCLLIFSSCEQPEPEAWTDLVPDKTPFLILPDSRSTTLSTLDEAYIPLFEETSPVSISYTREVFESAGEELTVYSILLYPSTSNEWSPVWLTSAEEGVKSRLAETFQQAFAQNQYQFHGYNIEILHVDDRPFYFAQIGSYAMISESSLAIEDMIRTFTGDLPRMALDQTAAEPGSFIINTPQLERWVEQLADISYRPLLKHAFDGSMPVALQPGSGNSEQVLWSLQGEMGLESTRAPLIESVSGEAGSFLLDQYIPSTISAYSIMKQPPDAQRPESSEPSTELDTFLEDNQNLFEEIAGTLHEEFAFVAFAESGFMSSSEFLFLRRLENPGELSGLLDRLVDEGLAQELEGDIYFVNSPWLGRLLGSDLSPLGGFYIGIHNQVAALSRSNSLVISVGSDYERRRVVYYDESYQQIREDHPDPLSSFTYIDSPSFNSYIQPWLFPQNYFAPLSSGVEILAMSTALSNSEALQFRMSSHERDEIREPFVERWTFPLQSELTGPPVMANITGSSRDEIVISTSDGSVMILAADGSPVAQTTTAPDTPIGSPVLYDWYGNNQIMVLQAAGNSIYAWNEAGSPLPNFPIELDETITSPLQVIDVTRNGVAELVVTTADRQLHILNARGNPISGWPQTTNSTVESPPLIADFQGERSIFAVAENSLHAWEANGSRRSGFPVFIDSRFTSSPTIYDDHLLASGADGNLYAIGESALFESDLVADSEEVGNSYRAESIDISNSALTHAPAVREEQIRVDDETITETLILTQSRNGSLHLHNLSGELRFTQSMGQTSSESTPPFFLDLDRDGNTDLVSVAASGRLYAWQILNGSQLSDLPTTAMSMPVITDLSGDGNFEIITHTREGLRVWTIYR